MLDDLVAHGLTDADSERLGIAFESLGRTAKRWPRPSDVLEHLPRKEKPLQLDAPNLSKEEIRANLDKIQSMVKGKLVNQGE